MRILHLTQIFSGLSETFIYDYILTSQRLGFKNQVRTLVRQNSVTRPFGDVSVLDLPNRYHPARVAAKFIGFLNGIFDETYAWSIYQKLLVSEFKKNPPNVIHAHFGPMGVLALQVSKSLQVPLVVTFYGYDISSLLKHSRWKKRYQKLFQECAAITVLSEDMRNKVHQAGCPYEKIHIVHLGKNTSDYHFQERRKTPRKFLSVGRLVEKKGFKDTIQAFHDVVSKGLEIELDILGGGYEEASLRGLVQKLGLQKVIRIHGALPHEEVKKYFEQADAFILSSKTGFDGDEEGTPTVLMEALAVGLPSVSTKHAGIPEIFPENQQWLLAEEGNILQISEKILKICQLSSEDIQKISKEGRSHIEKYFEVRTEVQKFHHLYQEIQGLPL